MQQSGDSLQHLRGEKEERSGYYATFTAGLKFHTELSLARVRLFSLFILLKELNS